MPACGAAFCLLVRFLSGIPGCRKPQFVSRLRWRELRITIKRSIWSGGIFLAVCAQSKNLRYRPVPLNSRPGSSRLCYPQTPPNMLKLGMVGANGQVGAELCLLLAAREDIELVAICRNRSGSSFLRWQGIACRHGRVADPTDAARLLSDCDVVVNSSLASGTPVEIRRIEAQIIRNVFEYSKAAATVIHFSTQSVYGDPRPGRWIRWRNPYGRAKLTTERRVRVESRRTKKPAHIFRLGHVCGSLQEISNTIRTEVRTGTVFLPAQNCSSNTVYTAAIIGAIEQILAGKSQAGTYDLMNSPRWSWREGCECEAGVCDLPLAAHLVDSVSDSRKFAVAATALRMAGE